MRIQDLEPKLQEFLAILSQHPKVMVACGARDVILYIEGARTQKMVEQKIPYEYREQVRIIPTKKVRPAHRRQ